MFVELAGPAGAGKTTLARVLRQRQENIRVAPEIELRNLSQIPRLAVNAPFLLSIFLKRRKLSRWFTWPEIKYILYLRSWPGYLQREEHGDVVLLDHGPVFKLAALQAFGPVSLNNPDYERWWRNEIHQWAFFLDLVVWLDAPDTVLMKRINEREQRHEIRGKPGPEARRFLKHYRISYEQVLNSLCVHQKPPVLRFDTGQTSIDQVAEQVLVACRLIPGRQ